MNVYKLKNGKTSGSFQLPIKNEMISKMVDGQPRLKKIHYIPGADSIFVEDYKGDQKPKSVWFEDGEIRVPEENWALNEILKNHSWFDKHYVLVNEDAIAEKEIAEFETLTRASNAIINETDELKIKATAMVIIASDDVANWSGAKCKTELLKYSRSHSKHLLAEMAKPDYESRFIAALAFNREIIKYNLHRTAVVWNDSKEGVIVRLAEGEKGVDKLGEFLSKKNDSSHSVLQRIGEKVEDMQATTNANVVSEKGSTEVNVTPSKSEAEIAAEAIEKYKATLTPVKSEADIRAEIEKEYAEKLKGQDTTSTDVKKEGNEDPSELEAARSKYKELFDKDVANLKKNDLKWINEAIASKLT